MSPFITGTIQIAALTLGLGAEARIPKVPEGHPRVYLRPADLPALRRKLRLEEFQEAWKVVRESGRHISRAFVYLATGEREVGREAVEGALRRLKRRKAPKGKMSDGRPFSNPMHHAACVYDWCYDLLTTEEKREFIREFKKFFADDHNRGYPPRSHKLNPITSHDSEGCIMSNLLPAGLAIYDEEPEMYELAARIFFDKYVDVRNFYYRAHAHHQGTGYAGTRFQHDQFTSWLFRKLGAGDVLSREQQFVPYHLLYATCSDKRLLPMGDCSQHPKRRHVERVTAVYYSDPYLLTWSDGLPHTPWAKEQGALWYDLLFLPPNAPRAPLSDLPLTKYFPSPMGEMIARTGWDLSPDSRDVVVHMRIGEYYFGNHQHRDWGTFQVYYRGLLAADTGAYHLGAKDTAYGSPHWKYYYQTTIAHNGLMVFDPATAESDYGGQRRPRSSHPRPLETIKADYHWGRVTAHAFGPDEKRPVYSYLAGDITGSYATTKVSRVRRSMVTFNTFNPSCPVLLVVFDDVVSTNPDFKKAWYLHSLKEPSVRGNTTTIVNDLKMDGQRDYNGQLVLKTLLPKTARIVKVGGPGKECWNEVTQKNYKPTAARWTWPREDLVGAWRVEVIPSRPAMRDLFLNAMTVTDKGTPSPAVRMIEGRDLVGAHCAGHAVLLNRTERPLTRTTFDIPGRDTTGVLVCGLQPGTWTVSGPRRTSRTSDVGEDAKCLYFRGKPGRYELRRR